MTENNIIDLASYQGNIAVDVSGGLLAPGGGMVEEGIYTATITRVGVMPGKNGKAPSLTLTLSGIGGRDTYDYLNLPVVDANGNAHDNAEVYARAIGQAAAAFGANIEPKNYGVVPVAALADWFQVGKQAKVYYIPSLLSENKGANGKRIVLSRQEVTYLTAEDVAKIASGDLTITRRLTPNADPTATTSGASLGTPAGGQGAPTLGGGAASGGLGGGNNGTPTLGGGNVPTLGGGQSPQPGSAPTLASGLANA